MNAREWLKMIIDLIDGVEQHLCASAPKKAKEQLREFRKQSREARTAKAHALYERKLNRFLESAPYLRSAGRRYITPKVVDALTRATKALKEATCILKQFKEHGENTPVLRK